MDRKFYQKRDFYIILVVVVIATIAVVLLWPKTLGNTAEVWYNGEIVAEISLSDDGIYPIDANLPVTLEIKDQKIRFLNAQCPDKICERFGWIGNAGDSATCMPARITVLVKEKN